jgi:PEP-CTERM motif-containing protein
MFKKLAVVLALSGALTLAAKADTQTLDSSAATTNNSVALGLTNAGATQAIVGNAAWAAPLAGSSWISFTTTGDTSNSNFYAVPNGTAVTFEQQFTLNGVITSAFLDVMADDTTSVVINGNTLYAPHLNGSYPTCSSIEIGCLTSTEGVFNTAQLLPYLNSNGVNTLDFTVYQKAGSSFGLDYAGAITTTNDRKVNTPEPGTMLMLGVGLNVLGLAATKLRS